MNYRKYILLLALGLGAPVSNALAADWYTLTQLSGAQTLWYFDAATVQKSKDAVQVWLKAVQTKKADSQGAWSTAEKVEYNCRNRTKQSLKALDYDQDGNHVKSYPSAKMATEIVPDTVGESIWQTVCRKDFPQPRDTVDYVKTPGNNPVAFTRSYVENADKAPAPQ